MMRATAIVLLVAATIAAAGAADSPGGRAVLPAPKRNEALKLASRLLEPRTPTWKESIVDLPDPFFRTNFAKVQEEVPVEPEPRAVRADLDVLQEAAQGIRPTGIMMVDGENYLLMGGKRYKAGAVLTVTLDGIVYSIVVSAIEGKSYSLRLNEQELRQQLK